MLLVVMVASAISNNGLSDFVFLLYIAQATSSNGKVINEASKKAVFKRYNIDKKIYIIENLF